jgi:opacity protein-like surface antigen
MTKKTTTICCALALLATTAATPALSQSKNFAGPSIAIGGTAIGTQTTYKITDTDANSASIGLGKSQNLVPSIDLSYSAPVSNNFLLGFGVRYDLGKNKGGTISGDITTTDILNGIDTATPGGNITADIRNVETLNLSYKDHYAAYIMPTYLVNNSTGVFAKFGYHKQKGTLSYRNVQTVTNTIAVGEDFDLNGPTYISETYTASGSKNFDAWGYGLGVKTLLTDNLYLQLDAEFIDYKSKSVVGSDGSTHSFKPESLAASISVGYKF